MIDDYFEILTSSAILKLFCKRPLVLFGNALSSSPHKIAPHFASKIRFYTFLQMTVCMARFKCRSKTSTGDNNN